MFSRLATALMIAVTKRAGGPLTMEEMRKALAAGALISLACFALVFWAVSHFLPLMPRLAASPWSNVFILFAVVVGPLVYLRKHRRKAKPARR